MSVYIQKFPVALPPNGPAGGDLSGTYPNPQVPGLDMSYAHVTGTGTIPNNVATQLTFPTTVELTGMSYVAPGVRVEAGHGGLYVVHVSAIFAPDTDGGVRYLQLFKGASTHLDSDIRLPYPVASVALVLSLTTVIRLADFESITVSAQQDSGGALNIDRTLRMTRTG